MRGSGGLSGLSGRLPVSAPQLDLALSPSRIYGAGLALLYGTIFPIIALAPMTALARAAFLLGAIGLAWSAWKAWQRQASVKRLVVLSESFRLVLANGQEVEAIGGSQTVLTSRLIILHILAGRDVYWMPLLPDSIDSEDFRRLNVWLRCRYPRSTA